MRSYGSDPFTYDLAAALGGRQASGLNRYGLPFVTFGFGRPTKARYGKAIQWPTVTVDGLKRHAKRFGTDCVEVTAKQLGVSESGLLELGFGGSTQERVRALAAQGFVAAEIEKRLNLSRPTVRRLLGAR